MNDTEHADCITRGSYWLGMFLIQFAGSHVEV